MSLDNLPEELRRSSRWVLWRLEDFEERKRCKIPKKPSDPARNASATDPDTWGSLEQAEANLPKLTPAPQYAEEEVGVGVGLVIGPPYLGVDLDKCYDPQTGVVDDWALQLLRKLPRTYTELSPSSRGFHLWYRCDEHPKLPDGIRTERVEVYARKRYLTVTGFWVASTIKVVTSLTLPQAKEIYERVEALRPSKKGVPTAVRPDNLKLEDMLIRYDYADLSAAVHSLLVRLAIHYTCNLEKVEEVFKTSGLYLHTHWGEKWARLRESELAKARDLATDNISKRLARQPDPRNKLERRAKVVRMDQVEPRELTWLWAERVPLGNVTIFAGDPGVGKSLMALDLLARGSIGASFLDGKPGVGTFKSLVLSMEDDRETIIVPRLMGMGADLSKIKAIDMIEFVDDVAEVKDSRIVNLETDLDLLRALIREDPEIKFLVIDPLSNYMGSKNMFRDQEFRSVIMPVVALAQETGIAVVAIMHNSKQQGRTALQKVAVALGGIGTARIGWTFVGMGVGHRHQMLLMKKNLGNFEGLEYTTKSVEVTIKGKTTKQANMEYLGVATSEADDVMISQEDAEGKRDRPVNELLRRLIPRGVEVPSTLVLDEASRASISPKMVQRARVDLGLKTARRGGQWFWSWPEESLAPARTDEAELF